MPLSFLTVWEMTFSLPAATLAGTLNLLGSYSCKPCYITFVLLICLNMLILDHGMLTLNRFILLDPPMLFFISASMYTMVKFHNQRDQ